MSSALYLERLPVRPLDMSIGDKNINIRLTGVSGDSVRTCIYYEIEPNPLDYQILEAFITDDQDKTYCLVSTERKGKDKFSTWMEFGPISPDTKNLKVNIIRLQQCPTYTDFTFKGRAFIDPWNPEFPLNKDLLKRMDSWLGSDHGCKDLATPEWEMCGSWEFKIEMGEWEEEEVDYIQPLSFNITLGTETIKFKEFRNSNTGSFIAMETADIPLETMGDIYKNKLIQVFNKVEKMMDFKRELREIGLDPGYVPVNLSLEIHDPESKIRYIPDFIDTRGVIGNRAYHFFYDCICGKKCKIVITEISNLKLNPPLKCKMDARLFSGEQKVKFNYEFDHFKVSGKIIFTDLILSEENIRINYQIETDDSIESLSLQDVNLVLKDDEGNEEVYPTLGKTTRFDIHKDILLFPAIHHITGKPLKEITLSINSINVKPKEKIFFEFKAPENPQCSCGK